MQKNGWLNSVFLVLWSTFLLSATCMGQFSKDSLLLNEAGKLHPNTFYILKLIEEGANINALDEERRSALSHAVSCENVELVYFLLKNGANPQLGDYHACPVYRASSSGNVEIVKLLINYGASLDACTASEFTPLHCAAEKGHDKVVELLISSGAYVNAADYINSTPLHRAVKINNTKIVRILIKAGADINIVNHWNESPISIAKKNGYTRISRVLEKHGANYNLQPGKKISEEEYITAYKEFAIREMHRTKIPASITLSLAMLKSYYGNSTIAREANNHFNLRCNSNWTDECFFYTDAPKVRYKMYDSVIKSYVDHSNYLATKSRYSSLFELKLTDYKEWAKRLRIAGYEPNPKFEKKLVSIIKENKLYLLDKIDKDAITTTYQNNMIKEYGNEK